MIEFCRRVGSDERFGGEDFEGCYFLHPLSTFFTPLLSHTYRWGLRGTDSFPLTRGYNQEQGVCV
ncbi:hypothetical protein Hanom_Chr13g01240521 [Helianthus anomalus]